MSTADQRSTDQRSTGQRATNQRGAQQHHSDARTASQRSTEPRATGRPARHRAEVEILTDLAHLPAWAAEVPERGYYDADVRSPEWVRARRQGLIADLAGEADLADRVEGAEHSAAELRERGRVFPTAYRENFVLGV